MIPFYPIEKENRKWLEQLNKKESLAKKQIMLDAQKYVDKELTKLNELNVDKQGGNLTMNHEKLKSCPFCGGKAELEQDGGYYIIECSSCKTNTSIYEDAEEVVNLWNTRMV